VLYKAQDTGESRIIITYFHYLTITTVRFSRTKVCGKKLKKINSHLLSKFDSVELSFQSATTKLMTARAFSMLTA